MHRLHLKYMLHYSLEFGIVCLVSILAIIMGVIYIDLKMSLEIVLFKGSEALLTLTEMLVIN